MLVTELVHQLVDVHLTIIKILVLKSVLNGIVTILVEPVLVKDIMIVTLVEKMITDIYTMDNV